MVATLIIKEYFQLHFIEQDQKSLEVIVGKAHRTSNTLQNKTHKDSFCGDLTLKALI